jgi:4-amino-4-deoxy-L-arabinose transferase-like glycosyltransferase
MLGVFNLLQLGSLFFLWATYLFIVTSILIKNRLKVFELFEKKECYFSQKLSSEEIIVLIVIACICLGTLLSAVIYPPNTWDSMTYHLSRVGYWAQNHSVSPYSTHNLRQLSANPLSEYFILNLYVLTGSDRLSNLVQWFSMLGSLVSVSLIAQSLGSSRKGQIYSALFCVTIPMGILQSSSTQNDYVAGFWIMSALYFLMAFWKNRALTNVLCLGISVGLGVLTKGTAYIYCTPILVLFLFRTLSLPINRALKYTLIVGFSVLTLNATHFCFNQSVFGHPLGLNSQEGVMNTENSAQIAISNSIKNMGLSLQTTIPKVDQAIESTIETLHGWLGISLSDPRNTFNLAQFYLKGAVLHEDGIGNHLHLLLIPIALFLLFIRRDLQMTVYVVCLMLCYILFGALLKWQPWGNRLLLTWFMAWTPIFGVLASNFSIKLLRYLLIGTLSLYALTIMLLNQSRPLVLMGATDYKDPYIKNYFVNNPELYAPYHEIARYINETSCEYIGLIFGADDWDYPLRQVLTMTDNGMMRSIYPVNVKNESARFEAKDNGLTCLIIDTSSINQNTIFLNPLGDKFERVFMNQKGAIYQRVIP